MTIHENSKIVVVADDANMVYARRLVEQLKEAGVKQVAPWKLQKYEDNESTLAGWVFFIGENRVSKAYISSKPTYENKELGLTYHRAASKVVFLADTPSTITEEVYGNLNTEEKRVQTSISALSSAGLTGGLGIATSLSLFSPFPPLSPWGLFGLLYRTWADNRELRKKYARKQYDVLFQRFLLEESQRLA